MKYASLDLIKMTAGEVVSLLKKNVVSHDGSAGTAGKNVGSKFFDSLIDAGRVVDRDSMRPAPLERQPFECPLEGLWLY